MFTPTENEIHGKDLTQYARSKVNESVKVDDEIKCNKILDKDTIPPSFYKNRNVIETYL